MKIFERTAVVVVVAAVAVAVVEVVAVGYVDTGLVYIELDLPFEADIGCLD